MHSNSIRPKFVKKTSLPNSVKSLGYIKCYSLSSPRWPVITPSNSIKQNFQKICSWSRIPKTILQIRKRPDFCRWSTILLFTSFFKDFTNHREKTNRTVVFSIRAFPNVLKYRDHQWDSLTIWKTRLFQTHIEEFS